MPEVIEVRPQGIYVKVDFNIEEIIKLKLVAEMTEVKFNSEVPAEVEAKNYFTKDFYPFIKKLIEDLKNGP